MNSQAQLDPGISELYLSANDFKQGYFGSLYSLEGH